jgi:hypothetical protein
VFLLPYSDRVLAFIDILGWSEIVSNEPSIEKVARAIFTVQRESDLHAAMSEFVDGGNLVQVTAFSDCVVLSCDATSNAAVQRLLTRLCRLYVELLGDGFMCRGAVVVGRASHQDIAVVGPALVEAYRLERDVAVYPRIILRDADLPRLDYEQGRDDRHVLRSEDGIPYLNPLLDWLPIDDGLADGPVRQTVTRLHGEWRAKLAELRKVSVPTTQRQKVIAKHEWLLDYIRRVAGMVHFVLG